MGQIVWKTTYHKNMSLSTINEGFYMVYELKADGQRTLVGTILK